jgi:hypothetical protein
MCATIHARRWRRECSKTLLRTFYSASTTSLWKSSSKRDALQPTIRASEIEVNLHRAAALALVGWVLLLPPLVLPLSDSHPEPLDVDRKAPLSEWIQECSFERAEDCERARKALPDEVMKQRSVIIPGKMGAAEIEQSHANLVVGARYALCVAADDPRLKKPK